MPHLCHDLHCPEQESSDEQLTIPSSSTTTPNVPGKSELESRVCASRSNTLGVDVQVHCVQRGAGSSPPRLSVSLSIAPLRPRDILNGFPIKQW